MGDLSGINWLVDFSWGRGVYSNPALPACGMLASAHSSPFPGSAPLPRPWVSWPPQLLARFLDCSWARLAHPLACSQDFTPRREGERWLPSGENDEPGPSALVFVCGGLGGDFRVKGALPTGWIILLILVVKNLWGWVPHTLPLVPGPIGEEFGSDYKCPLDRMSSPSNCSWCFWKFS